MTYAEAVEYLAELEAAFATGAVSVTIGDRTISYGNQDAMRRAMAQLRRDIDAYENRALNRNPGISRPRWR
jgi:hypothetical protein